MHVQLQLVFAESCTFFEKGASGLELVPLLSRNMQVANSSYTFYQDMCNSNLFSPLVTLFSRNVQPELHFSSRYVQLQPVSAMSYIFLEIRATGLE
jgi:hypothetical protein